MLIISFYTRRIKKALKLEEVRYYFLIILVATGIIFMNLLQTSMGIWDSLRHAAFQVATIITTTGYSTVDFNAWCQTSKTVLVLLMFVGAWCRQYRRRNQSIPFCYIDQDSGKRTAVLHSSQEYQKDQH